MSEKLPMGERPEPLITEATPEETEQIRAIFANHFGNHISSLTEKERGLLPRYEIQKNADDIQIIEIANKLTNQLLADNNLPQFNIPVDNIHLYSLRNARVSDVRARSRTVSQIAHGHESFFDPISAAILVRVEEGELFDRANALLHEMIHAKQFMSVSPRKEGDAFPFRIVQGGLKAMRRFRKNEKAFVLRFGGLNEAVTSAIERRLYPFLLAEHPTLSVLADTHYDSADALKRKEEFTGPTRFYPDDIISVQENPDGSKRVIPHSYPSQHDFFHFLCSEIAEESKQSTEGVVHEFIRAHFTGDCSIIEKLVDSTFGTGAFEVLGRMRPKSDSPEAALRTLRRMRELKK